MHIYVHFLFCYFIFLLESKRCVFCLPLVKRQLSTSTWQTQANKTHFQEYLDKIFKNNDSTLVNSARISLIDELFNFFLFPIHNSSAFLSNSGTTFRRCDRYEGNLKHGMKDGYGTFYYADGRKYAGYWANDKYNGQGVFTSPEGGRYEGGFKNGDRNGNGTLYVPARLFYGASIGKLITNESGIRCFNYSSYEEPFINGDINVNYSDHRVLFSKYVGEWVDGLYHGQGSLTWSSGKRYEGTFKNHRRNGNGTYYTANGTKYVCEWIDDKINGHCLVKWTNGDQYDGNIKNETPYGNGTYYFVDESKYMISWSKGKLINHGVFISNNGSRYEGPILDSKLRVMKIKP